MFVIQNVTFKSYLNFFISSGWITKYGICITDTSTFKLLVIIPRSWSVHQYIAKFLILHQSVNPCLSKLILHVYIYTVYLHRISLLSEDKNTLFFSVQNASVLKTKSLSPKTLVMFFFFFLNQPLKVQTITW